VHDVFDGKASEFLEASNNQLSLALLHVDGFNPFKRGGVSMTTVIITILDLPPEERVKQENILVLDIVPACQKRSKQDLLILESKGMNVIWNDKSMLIKAHLVVVIGDIPGVASLCMHAGH
jgi:hypothetical protein